MVRKDFAQWVVLGVASAVDPIRRRSFGDMVIGPLHGIWFNRCSSRPGATLPNVLRGDQRGNPTMDFRGYVDRVEFHFDRLGVTERPSQQEYVDAWNNQIPAKKMAQSFARRRGKAERAARTQI